MNAPPPTSPWPACARLFAAAAVVVFCGTGPAGAGPLSDPFGTGTVLRNGTPGLTDPSGRECGVPAAPLTLATTIDLALCRNPATRATWAAARQQAAALGIAESAWVPNLGVSGSETWTDGERSAGTLGVPVVAGTQRSTDAAVNLSWTLYDFGGREAKIASARRLLDAAASTADSVSQQTVLAAVQAFYGVVAADAGLVAAKSAEDAAAKSLEVARGRRDAGVATRADVLQAETAFDQAVLVRVQADGALASARGTLAVTIGAPADRSLKLDAEPTPAEVPALTQRVADLMAEAARQRPDLAAALADRDAAAEDVTSARASGRPSITVGASRNFVDTPGVPNQNYNTVGVSVSWPLFTGFSTTYRVRQAEAALAAREANAEQVRLSVSLDVWNGYAALDSAGQQLKASAALLKSAEENEQVALGRYKAGVGTIVDVLTAQSALAGARQQRIAAERGWQVAKAQLALALGRLSSAEPLAGTGGAP
jgi:outer membrane protein